MEVGMNFENPREAGPEYDAYLMREEAQELAALSDSDIFPALKEIELTIKVLTERLGEFRRVA
jgi:hypothetical protein